MKCLNPIVSKQHKFVPCGKCLYCRMRRNFEWQTRLLLESVTHKFNYFVTLTYNDDHCDGLLHKQHLKLFCDDMRRATKDFRFYAVGEYGSRTHRPHYHLHVFTDIPYKQFRKFVKTYWNRGFYYIGGTSAKSIAYVCKWHNVPKENGEQHGFASMSSGLGREWCDRNEVTYKYRDGIKIGGMYRHFPRYVRDRFGQSPVEDDFDLFEIQRYYQEIFGGSLTHSQWTDICDQLEYDFVNNSKHSKL